MNSKKITKSIKAYSKYYRHILENEGVKDAQSRMDSFIARLKDMYGSDAFAEHSIYPSIDVCFVYAVIAMCLELKELGYSDDRIIPAVEKSL